MTPDEPKNLHYDQVACSAPACSRLALTGRETCWEHLADRGGYCEEIVCLVRAGEDLHEYVLDGIGLSGEDLGDARLEGAVLNGADLRRVQLRRAALSRAFLAGADLSDGLGAGGSGLLAVRQAVEEWAGM